MHSRPAITANWRLEPNLTSQLALATARSARRHQARRGSEAKPLIDQTVNQQVSALEPAAQRSLHRAHRARAVGEDVPLAPARRRQHRPAGIVAGDAADPRRRRAAADRRPRRDAHRRRAGGNAHRAGGDQALLPVPGQARAGAADGQRQARGRRADRPAVHRAQQALGGAAQGPYLSGRRQSHRSMSRCSAPTSAPPATGC